MPLVTRRGLLAGGSSSLLLPRRSRAWLHPGKSSAPPPVVVGNLVLNLGLDSSWNTNPNVSQWNACLTQVVKEFNTFFNMNVTLDYQIGYGTVNGTPVSLGTAQSEFFNQSGVTTYPQIKSGLLALPSDAVKAQAYATLPTSDPSPWTGTWAIHSGLWGVWQNNGTHVVNSPPFSVNASGWSTSVSWDTSLDGSCAPGKVSLCGDMKHELSEVIGRWSGINPSTQIPQPLDLFTYSSPGTRSWLWSASRYFSIDSGTTNTGGTDADNGGSSTAFYNTGANLDYGGWGGTYNSFFNEQVVQTGITSHWLPGDVALGAVCGWPLTAYGAWYAGF